jgi:hypothetical protein
MFKEARRIGAAEWEAQVQTQADLEQWADRTARKYKRKQIKCNVK